MQMQMQAMTSVYDGSNFVGSRNEVVLQIVVGHEAKNIRS
jgi:hypothetical protein